MNAAIKTIDRRPSYFQREAANRDPGTYYARVMRGLRLSSALTERFKRQDVARRVSK